MAQRNLLVLQQEIKHNRDAFYLALRRNSVDEHALGLGVVQRYLDTGDVDLGGEFDAVEELTHTNPYLLAPAVAGVGEAGVAGEVLIGRVLSIFFGLGFLGRVSDKFFNRNFGRVFGKFFGEDFEILVVWELVSRGRNLGT
ncbi:hypothetical protein PG995_006301 [Apiospora arundinis]